VRFVYSIKHKNKSLFAQKLVFYGFLSIAGISESFYLIVLCGLRFFTSPLIFIA